MTRRFLSRSGLVFAKVDQFKYLGTLNDLNNNYSVGMVKCLKSERS